MSRTLTHRRNTDELPAYREIGIIAPYHAQCQKIRRNLRAIGAEDIKVGSTEEFQGQERRVMLISTIRSSREFVEYDLRHTLGFVANPRRFNGAHSLSVLRIVELKTQQSR